MPLRCGGGSWGARLLQLFFFFWGGGVRFSGFRVLGFRGLYRGLGFIGFRV